MICVAIAALNARSNAHLLCVKSATSRVFCAGLFTQVFSKAS
jgi:hypothetical protein